MSETELGLLDKNHVKIIDLLSLLPRTCQALSHPTAFPVTLPDPWLRWHNLILQVSASGPAPSEHLVNSSLLFSSPTLYFLVALILM